MVEFIPYLSVALVFLVACGFFRIIYIRGFKSGIERGMIIARRENVVANSPVAFGNRRD